MIHSSNTGTSASSASALTRYSALAALMLALLGPAGCGEQAATPEEAAAEPEQAEATTAPGGRAAAVQAATADINDTRIGNANSEPGNWLAHGRTYDEQRYSPLTNINPETAADLGLAWYWDTGTKRGLEASPIVVDGVMFSTGSWSVVWAHDAKTGELLWSHDPQVPREWGKYACCDVVNRGAAVWEGRVYSGTLDGRLIALDAGTGELIWEVQTTDRERPYTITGAPRIVKDKVIIGNGGAEYGVRGYVTAYDAASGAMAWRFYTVPGNPDGRLRERSMEALPPATWRGGKWWEVGGGGTVWDSMAFDPELNLLYVGVGNGSPWNRYIRSPGGGDNLYVSSIVALNPDNGSLVWHYQTTPGDTWDYTATQHMILADIEIDGETRKVIMQAPKERLLLRARPHQRRVHLRGSLRAGHLGQPHRPGVRPPGGKSRGALRQRRERDTTGALRRPQLASYDLQPGHSGLVYIPALELSFSYGQDNAFKYDPEAWNTGVDFQQAGAN